ncbi:MAG: metallophosphoesterase [Novosphingobium sp.]|uniref:metallophosphoesterase n=1 Tax=Novosphingobium sp. TaxID=1874826 RepID=UPI003018EAA1
MTPACRVIADVHGQADWLAHALDSTALPVVLLGDLIDRGPDSPGALRVALAAIEAGRATLLRSNHDDKLYRLLCGRQPQIGPDLAATLEALSAAPDGADIKTRFVRAYAAAPYWLVHGRHILLHGAFAPEMLELAEPAEAASKPLRSKLSYLALYAEGRMVAGEALPIRTYQWVETIPAAWTVIAGHDVRSRETPLVMTNRAGGRAIFLDTGAGAGGRLSWIDLPEETVGQIG